MAASEHRPAHHVAVLLHVKVDHPSLYKGGGKWFMPLELGTHFVYGSSFELRKQPPQSAERTLARRTSLPYRGLDVKGDAP
jgi:hypothetical protein